MKPQTKIVFIALVVMFTAGICVAGETLQQFGEKREEVIMLTYMMVIPVIHAMMMPILKLFRKTLPVLSVMMLTSWFRQQLALMTRSGKTLTTTCTMEKTFPAWSVTENIRKTSLSVRVAIHLTIPTTKNRLRCKYSLYLSDI